MIWRITIGLWFTLGVTSVTNVTAQMTASPKDAMKFQEFKPQADEPATGPSPSPTPQVAPAETSAVQQDAPASTAPKPNPAPSAPLPLMLQIQNQNAMNGLSSGGSSQNSGEVVKQVLQNMIKAYSAPATKSSTLGGDSASEGNFISGAKSEYCPTCAENARNGGISRINPDDLSFGSTGNACRDRILTAAREVAAQYRRSRSAFRGVCAQAVRTALQKAGLNSIGPLGDAKDMGPNLEKLGFMNVKKSSNPDDAPEGAVLVYGPATRPFCAGKGSIYGHVEVKDFNGLFHYDGTSNHNIQKRFGADCRPLIGVYLPGPALEKKC